MARWVARSSGKNQSGPGIILQRASPKSRTELGQFERSRLTCVLAMHSDEEGDILIQAAGFLNKPCLGFSKGEHGAGAG